MVGELPFLAAILDMASALREGRTVLSSALSRIARRSQGAMRGS